MKIFHKTSAISFSLLHSGFQAFKKRVCEIVCATSLVNIDDYMDDDQLCSFYRSGESPEYVAAMVTGSYGEDDWREAF